MDAAREIQILYRNQTLSDDLGGSQLYRYMEQLGLPYIPTINHLNAARRGEISKGRYNMKKSREVEERYILKKWHKIANLINSVFPGSKILKFISENRK